MRFDHFLEHFQARLLQDAIQQATASFWLRRAAEFEAARPTPSEYPGSQHEVALRRKWHELTEIAQACRNRAAVALFPSEIEADVWAAVRGHLGEDSAPESRVVDWDAFASRNVATDSSMYETATEEVAA